jgi:hypothetical protein
MTILHEHDFMKVRLSLFKPQYIEFTSNIKYIINKGISLFYSILESVYESLIIFTFAISLN